MLMWRSTSPARAGERDGSVFVGEIELANVPSFRIGAMDVHPPMLSVVEAGETRTIEPRIMQVLVALARAGGSVVSRDRLVELCWGGRAISDDAINRAIAKVRPLGAEHGAFEIETIPRVGYRLIACDREESAAPAARGRWRPMQLAFVAALFVLLAGAALWHWRGGGGARQPVIAVLPFTALNADAEVRNDGESIAATISNALVQTGAQLPEGVRTADDARRSGAALIVSGTIRRDGPNLWVTTRVDSARDGSSILSNEDEAAANQVPALAGGIAAWLIPPVRMWSSFLPVEPDAATNEQILRIFLTRGGGNPLRAWELSRALAAAKPDSGAAQLVLALLTSDVLGGISADQRPAAVASARQAAERAAQLLPDPARALAVLDCHLRAPGWQVLTQICDRRTRAAIAVNPDVPLLPFLFASQLAQSGRFAEAAKMVDMDLAQNPLGPNQLVLRILITPMLRSGDTDHVLPELKSRMRRYTGPGSTAYFDFHDALFAGDMGAAEAILDNPVSGPNVGAEGMSATLRLVFRAVKSKSPADIAAMRASCNPPAAEGMPADPAFGACLVGLTQVGDLDAVFALAARGYRDVACCSARLQDEQWLASGGDYNPRWELFGAGMARARADPRFIELARRTGLLAYWKSGRPPDFCAFERAPVCALLKRSS